jgi:hypothetical protein
MLVDVTKEDVIIAESLLKCFHPYRVLLDFIRYPLYFQHWRIQGAER